jgi:hypothetical protein
MIDPTAELDVEEKKLLTEAFSDGEVRVGPSQEYVAELRRRLLSSTTHGKVVREKSNRRLLLGSILGACAAAILFAAVWFSNAEPAWASAIRMAREQPWIHAEFERDDSPIGQIWISPERDIVAAKLATAIVFLDYKHETFLRYDLRERLVYRASQPESAHLIQELSSVSSLAAMFRRSPGPSLLVPNQSIEGWGLQSRVVDGIACDEYEIVIRPPEREPTTLRLTVDKRRLLPRSLTIAEGESHTMISRFDYPVVGPLDERSSLLGIPADVERVDVDKAGGVLVIDQSLRKQRENFDDYTSLGITAQFDNARPLMKRELKRVLRRANKWRVDAVDTSGADFDWPKDYEQGLIALRKNRDRMRFVPELICDGQVIYHYTWRGKSATTGSAIESFRLTDRSRADSLSPTLLFPERACRPIFQSGALDRVFKVKDEGEDLHEGLFRVDVSRTPNVKTPDTYWLDASLGNVAVRMVLHPAATSRAVDSKLAPRPRQIALRDFMQSPQGFWYPSVVSLDLPGGTKQITRLYVDFTDVPSDEMFRTINPAP